MTTGSEAESAPARSAQLVAPRKRPSLAESLLMVVACMLALVFALDVCALLVSGAGAERRDFISYWAAGQQIAHHRNPYDADAILNLERSLGFPPAEESLIVRNPPTALLLVAPMGFIGFRLAALLWSQLLLACWLVSFRLLWHLLGRPQSRFALLGYPISPGFVLLFFGPALTCIFYGQTALLALLGLALFLRFHRSHPWLAGASLWLCALKPHLFVPFAIVLLLWIVLTRSYAILAGAALALGASALGALALDPAAWSQYTQMIRTAGMEREFIPCLSIALRFAINPNAMWLQYVPAALGCVWAVYFYWIRRAAWDWLRQGPMLVLVSVLVSPYAWLTDQSLAIPALMLVAYRANFRALLLLALASSAIELQVLGNVTMHSALYLWTAPVWLAWYLYARRSSQPEDLASH